MESIHNFNDYYGYNNENICLSASYYFKNFRQETGETETCSVSVSSKDMSAVDDPVEILIYVWHILCTTLPAVFWFALGRVIMYRFSRKIRKESLLHFTMEFIVIVLPLVISINVINESVEIIVIVLTVIFINILWHAKCLKRASGRSFTIGSRPQMLTLGRAAINIITALCILAVDFESFPKHFRKTRRYGVGLMDTGIGLFVFAMGSVSKRPRQMRDFKRMLRIVVPLLVLGILRTVVVMAIDYPQDEHEYGKHMNAFFTLGFTKFFGCIVSCIPTKDIYLLPLGILILIIHEIFLQLGVADFVMDSDLQRIDLITANREGIHSLPGFVGIYIISMYLGYIWQTAETPLSFKELTKKMGQMALISLSFWFYVIVSVYTVSISRVTCNFGYAFWTLGTASLMILLFMFVFDLVLNTLYPTELSQTLISEIGGEGADLDSELSSNSKLAIPMIVEAVNMNGLVFFLIANMLTGTVNLFLSPQSRSNFEGYIILCIYMYLTTYVVYRLYRRNFRIG